VDRSLKESIISGALIALEEARQEGNVRYLGLAARDVYSAQSLLHFHDAFEVLATDSAQSSETSGIRAIARSRRVALVTQTSNLDFDPGVGEAALYCVRSSEDIDKLMQIRVAVA
jgi:hypothetical protein